MKPLILAINISPLFWKLAANEFLLFFFFYNFFTNYLRNPHFKQKKSSLLFALRTKTVRGIKSDFGGLYADKQCPMPGCSHPDTLAELLTCPAIMDRMEDTGAPTTVTYDDVFSEDIKCLRRVTDRFEEMLEARKEILGDPGTPAAAPAGPLHLLHPAAPAAKL